MDIGPLPASPILWCHLYHDTYQWYHGTNGTGGKGGSNRTEQTLLFHCVGPFANTDNTQEDMLLGYINNLTKTYIPAPEKIIKNLTEKMLKEGSLSAEA
ncbi:hypothetical protein GJ744_006434 [Endocarpon pusillum]|uniref:Uncharacterized protein n=1 Tax=Endocarpon pusillum TaxID=364733 RepID=A0A8H7A7W6_9EURO|nr:hypothetical protein GJ744_006434 [Endocarpon pusillum]